MKKLLMLLLLVNVCPYVRSQSSNPKGINWVEGLSWDQVKLKARQENKYIFIDCYATWCGPCKEMDRRVYNQEQVADLFNDKVIAVRLQFDRTREDNAQVKQWYPVVAELTGKYHIDAYPTLLYLSPEGKAVHKEVGFREPGDFLSVTRKAMEPGKVYKDPAVEMQELTDAYISGKPDYTRMPELINYTRRRNAKLGEEMRTHYLNYLSGLKEKELLREDNLRYMSKNMASSSVLFSYYYPKGSKIDRIMKKKGYTRYVVDSVINAEYVGPFLQQYKKGVAGYAKEGHPAWEMLKDSVTARFNEAYGDRADRRARFEYCLSTGDGARALNILVDRINHKDMDMGSYAVDGLTNTCVWSMCGNNKNREDLAKGILYMGKSIDRLLKRGTDVSVYIDTYGVVQYKYGIMFADEQKIQDGIAWEQRALDMADEYAKQRGEYDPAKPSPIQKVLDRMKKREIFWRN